MRRVRVSAVLVKMLVAAIAIYLAFGLILFLAQRSLLFPRSAPTVEPIVPNGSVLRIDTDGELPVFALYVPAAPHRKTIVHFHGNGEQLGVLTRLATTETRSGLGFFAVEFPGYGLARAGRPSERSIVHAAEIALEHLRRHIGVSDEAIVLQGQSLGSGVAAAMAARGFGSQLVLVSPYTSIADLGQRSYPIFPVRLLALDRFDTARLAPKIRIPTLILTGTDDEVVPTTMATRLAGLFPHAVLRRFPGRHHNDMLDDPGLFDEIEGFIRGPRS